MNKKYIDFVPVKKTGVEVVLPQRRARGASGVVNEVASEVVDTSVIRHVPKKNVRRAARDGRSSVGSDRGGLGAGGGSTEVRRGTESVRAAAYEYGDDVDVLDEIDELFAEKVEPMMEEKAVNGADKSAAKGAGRPKYGVIEEVKAKFVTTKVEKRPLGRGRKVMRGSVATEVEAGSTGVANATRSVAARGGTVVGKGAVNGLTGAEKSATSGAANGAGVARSAAKVARASSRIQVEKRPLSRSVAQRKPVAKAVTEAKPVRIVESESADSRVKTIATVVITVILGAVAGVVAFLLLPK